MWVGQLLALVVMAAESRSALRATVRPSIGHKDGVIRIRLQHRDQIHPHRRGRSLLQLKSEASAAMKSPKPAPVEVFGNLFIGTPPQEMLVAFDTGGGNLLLPSKNCNSLSCAQHQGYKASESATEKDIEYIEQTNNLAGATPAAMAEGLKVHSSKEHLAPGAGRETVEIAVGTGSAEGILDTDRVCLGPNDYVCTTMAFVEMTSETDDPWSIFPYDGILGLGLPGVSLGMQFNLIGQLSAQQVLKHNTFAIWLKTAGDEDDSELTVGNFDEDRLGSQILWLHVSDITTGLWEVQLTDFSVDAVALGLCGDKGCRAALDTGTGAISIPAAHLAAVLAQLNVAHDCSNYEVLPKLCFVFDSWHLCIDQGEYVVKNLYGCYHQLVALDIPPPRGPLVLLGDPFMRRYYTVFDRDSLKVGFSFSRHKVPSIVKKDETNEEARTRLFINVAQSED